MKRQLLNKKIKGYIKQKEIYKDENFTVLIKYYIDKARHNLLTARTLFKLSEDKDAKKGLSLSEGFYCYDWVISVGYYAMFHSATAILGKIGIRARSHEALIDSLEYHFVYKEKLMETEFVEKISEAKALEDYYVNRMWAAKSKRRQATYKAESTISMKNAEKILDYAQEFINRVEELMLEL